MKVKLKNDWFAPNGTLYRVVDNPHTFPDAWKDNLPKSVEELPAKDVESYAEEQKRLLKEHDPLAVDNSSKYEWPQPEGNLLADATPSKPSDDDTPEKKAAATKTK